MKKLFPIIAAALLMSACGDSERALKERAAELCKYIPDHELLEKSIDYLTADFYEVLDTLFHLPEFEAMDHEWLYFFVTGNGGTIADYEVVAVEKTDPTHAIATISVRQKWEDGSFDETSDTEEHQLEMQKVDGQWLMSDFDGHKADCIRHIAQHREEESIRQAISNYLVHEIGFQYLKGELCIPTLLIVYEEKDTTGNYLVWGDYWLHWYDVAGDTLKSVSGGNHAGLIALVTEGNRYHVSSFEQVTDGAGYQESAGRIFGAHYDIYESMHSNQDVREAVRREQLQYYLHQHNLPYSYYQDYGWPAKAIE